MMRWKRIVPGFFRRAFSEKFCEFSQNVSEKRMFKTPPDSHPAVLNYLKLVRGSTELIFCRFLIALADELLQAFGLGPQPNHGRG